MSTETLTPKEEMLDAMKKLQDAVVRHERMRVHTGGNLLQLMDCNREIMKQQDRIKDAFKRAEHGLF